MNNKKEILSLALAVILAASLVLPAAAAEPSESGAVTETEISPEPDTLQEETADDAYLSEETAEKTAEEEREEEIPDVRNAASSEIDLNGNSTWLSDYSYKVRNGRLYLTAYNGSETDVAVPGTAAVSHISYDRIYLTAGMWEQSAAVRLSFEKGVSLPENSSGMFSYSLLKKVDLSKVDASAVTDMSDMFKMCWKMQEIELSGFDTSSVEDMSYMFYGCSALTSLDLNGFDTSRVRSMNNMFDGCTGLVSLDISSFDTSSVTDMSCMFESCSSLISLDVSGFDTSAVTDMSAMFCACSLRQKMDLGSFDTSSVTDMSHMFAACVPLPDIAPSYEDPPDLPPPPIMDQDSFGASVTDTYGMPLGASSGGSLNISSFDTSSVTDMSYMFSGCSDLTELDLSGFNTTSVTDMSHMFEGCSSLAYLDIGTCDLSSLARAESMLDFSSLKNNVRIWTPCNLSIEVGLDTAGGNYYSMNGKSYKSLPQNTGFGLLIVQNGKIAFTSLISSAAAAVGEDAVFEVTFSGIPLRGVWQYMEPAGSDWTDYKWETEKAALQRLVIPATREWNGRTLRLVLYDAWEREVISNEAEVTVTGAEVKDIALCTVTLARNSYPFTGAYIVPGVTVKDEAAVLTEGTDYTVTCSNNRNSGTASAVIAGMGNYTGSVTKNFTITKIDQEMEAVISASGLTAGERAAITVTGNKGDLVFASSDAAVASVDSAGLVTALSAGETVITVTAKMTMNYNKAVAQIPVTVTDAPEETGRSIEEISYSFANAASAFSYPSGYKIPLSSYQIIYGDNTRAEAVYMAHSRNAWGGNCAGISATSALMTTAGGGVHPYSFRTGASAPRDLAVTDTSSALSMNLTTFVEAMHIAQYTEAFSNERKAHVVYTTAIQAGNRNLDELYNAVKSKAESDIPTVLALVQAGGHAVLAYKTQEVSGTESRIYIYDSNFPLQDRYITFYKNGGHYTQWSYDMGSYGEWGTDSSASSISYVAFATLKSIWDSRGNVGKDEASLAFVNSQNFAVYDVKGNLEAVFSGGSLSDYTGKISRISDELSLTGSGTQEVVLSIPTKTHTIVNLDRTLSSFAVTVVDTDLGISVDTTVQEVTLSVDDEYSVSSLSMDAGTGDTYSVTLSSSFASGYDKVEVSGTGQGETLSISQSGTSLNFSNCDISLLMVDGQQVGVYEITASATEGGSISPSGTTSLRQGESLACTITPDTGYAIQDVFVDNKSVGAVSSYTFENVRGGHTILATFKKAQTTLETPKVSSVTNVKDGIKIAWGRVEGAENYRIYYKVNGGSWKRLTETTDTSYTWTGAESGNTYGFTIRCMNAAGTSFTSGYDNTGKSVAYVAAPSVTKLESLAGGVRITWTKSTGAALYRIYYKEGTGGWKKLVDTTDTAYTWTGAQSGKTYGFTVRCMNAAGTSFTSGYDDTGKTITYVKPSEIPEVTALSAVSGGLKIDWSSYEGAGVYAVYYKTGTGAGGWKKLTNVSGTSYTWTGAADGTTYSFTVRAMNDAGTSFVSGYNNTGMSIAYKALASVPKVTSVTNVQGGVKIAWSAFTGAGSYRIFYKESGGSWKKLCDAAGTSYTWTGAVSGSFYAFTVRALNAAGTSFISGYDNTGRSITYVAAPVITTLKKVSGGIQIAWGTCTGAGSYRIFVKANGGGWKKLTDVSGTSYTWTGAAAGNTYGFTVRCMDAGSASFVSGYDNTGKSLDF